MSCTLYLFKHVAGTHIRNHQENFLLSPTNLETNWLKQACFHPNLNINLCHHFLKKLLLYYITNLSQITLPNGTHLMTPKDFQIYHSKSTKIICSALKLASQLFCHPPCNNHCQHPCMNHQSPNTLLPQYIILDHHITPPQSIVQNPPLIKNQPSYLLPQIWLTVKHTPINSIIKYKQCTTKNKVTIIKKYHSYLCTWIYNNCITYAKWISQSNYIKTYTTIIIPKYYNNITKLDKLNTLLIPFKKTLTSHRIETLDTSTHLYTNH